MRFHHAYHLLLSESSELRFSSAMLNVESQDPEVRLAVTLQLRVVRLATGRADTYTH